MSWLKDILKGLDDSRVPRVAVSGTFTGVADRSYEITVETPGLSGTATIAWLDSEGNSDDSIVVTSGSAIAIGADGLEVTFDFAGRLPDGLGWAIRARSDGSFDTPVLYAAGELESDLATPVRIDPETGSIQVSITGDSTEFMPLYSRHYEQTLTNTTPSEVAFTGFAHCVQITFIDNTTEQVQVSFDGGGTYPRRIFSRGTLTWNPPAGYSNAAPLESVFLKATAAGTYHVEITAWETLDQS